MTSNLLCNRLCCPLSKNALRVLQQLFLLYNYNEAGKASALRLTYSETRFRTVDFFSHGEIESGIVLRVSILQFVALSRYKVVSRTPGNYLGNPSGWLSAAVKRAFQDLDFGPWSETAYGRSQLTGKGKGKWADWDEQA